jgi:hypothetical protein
VTHDRRAKRDPSDLSSMQRLTIAADRHVTAAQLGFSRGLLGLRAAKAMPTEQLYRRIGFVS